MSSHVKLILFADDIGSNIEGSHAATAQAKSQLAKAAKTQRSNSSLVIYDASPPPPPFFPGTKWQRALTSLFTLVYQNEGQSVVALLLSHWFHLLTFKILFIYLFFWLIRFLFFCADMLALGDIWDCASHCSHSTCGLIRSSLIR